MGWLSLLQDGVENSDELSHDRGDHNFERLAFALQPVGEGLFVCGGYGYDASKVLANDQGQISLCLRDGSDLVGLGCDLQAFVLEEFDRLALLHNDKGMLGAESAETVHPAIKT